MSTLRERLQLLQPGELIELFILDLTSQNGPVLYFHPYAELGANTITFQGNVYQPFPIKAEGWDWNTKGTLPRPNLSVSNIDGVVTAMMRLYNDFIGCKITRKRTFAEFLDGEPGANPEEEFTPDIYYVDRKARETNMTVEFELATLFDSEGVMLPRRQILANYCPWLYRGAECGYDGPPVADVDDNPIVATNDRGAHNPASTYAIGDYVYVMVAGIRVYYSSLIDDNERVLTDSTAWVRDTCSKCIRACKLRFGADNPLPFGGFPGASKIPTV